MMRGFVPVPVPPSDFVEFWERIAWSQANAPLDVQRYHFDTDDTPTHQVERISFIGADGVRIHGWLGTPKEQTETLGGLLWLPAYGLTAHPIYRYTVMPNFVTLSINLLGHPPHHNEAYQPSKGYITEGIASPETYIYSKFIITALRALDVLSKLPEVNPDKLICGGMSQGGGLALWLSTLTSKLKAACCDMPFFISHEEYWSRPHHQYPYKEIFDLIESQPKLKEPIWNTLQYYDTLSFAPHVRCPVQISGGEKDPKVKLAGVSTLFMRLPYPKNMIKYDRGHEWVKEMPVNNFQWISQFIKR